MIAVTTWTPAKAVEAITAEATRIIGADRTPGHHPYTVRQRLGAQDVQDNLRDAFKGYMRKGLNAREAYEVATRNLVARYRDEHGLTV
ncbi:hypothetical protein [Streptomyces sp. MNU103]|uniref:hypothetical protein n=1 Tax=Streptomyces sp. MNU103 TaxID=2560024 RepID=UPI001E58CEA5|nr:hypothetical protein [Streptomyces sp. MNU103]